MCAEVGCGFSSCGTGSVGCLGAVLVRVQYWCVCGECVGAFVFYFVGYVYVWSLGVASLLDVVFLLIETPSAFD